MSDQAPRGNLLRIARLAAGQSHGFDIAPDAGGRAAIAAELGISAIRKLRFAGALLPLGRADWRLEAKLGATVVQPCVATLAPVVTRIDDLVERTYLANPPPLPDEDEIEMPEDDSVESLPEVLDLGAVMIEALALALPAYPHAESVAPLKQSFTEPGKQAMSDDDARPFAGLAALRGKLDGNDEV